MDAIELLTTTKGVRKRIDFDRPVPYALLEECVEIAVKAPLGGEEWQPHFLVIDDANTKARIGEIYNQINGPYIDDIEAIHVAFFLVPFCCMAAIAPLATLDLDYTFALIHCGLFVITTALLGQIIGIPLY